MEAYDNLMKREKEYLVLTSAYSIVQWDYETYMPPKGLMLKSEQLSLLQQILHRMGTDPEIGSLLDELEKNRKKLSDVQNRNVFIVRREYDKDTKIPEDLVARIGKQTPISLETWKKAKASNNWKLFEPELQKTVNLSREKAEIEMQVKVIPIVCLMSSNEA
jgi:carboxypeptidase Taq